MDNKMFCFQCEQIARVEAAQDGQVYAAKKSILLNFKID